jgi:hypothetical protein
MQTQSSFTQMPNPYQHLLIRRGVTPGAQYENRAGTAGGWLPGPQGQVDEPERLTQGAPLRKH